MKTNFTGSEGGPSSNTLHGVWLCIVAEAVAAWGFVLSIILPAIRTQPPPPQIIKTFVVRYRPVPPKPQETEDEPPRKPSVPRSFSESTIREIKGRPRASSDPTGTTSRPDLFRTRAAMRARRCMSIAGAACAKTAIPARPIVKGAHTVLRSLSINNGALGKKVEDDEEDDEEEDEKIQNSATPAILRSAHLHTKNGLNRSPTVATAVKEAPIGRGFSSSVAPVMPVVPVVYSEEETTKAEGVIVEELPEHVKLQSKFRMRCSRLSHRLTALRKSRLFSGMRR
ncbi:hypothetical protein ACEPAG_2349 [Sanghuangporus baumii]